MLKLFSKFFKDKSFDGLVAEIGGFETWVKSLKDQDFSAETQKLKESVLAKFKELPENYSKEQFNGCFDEVLPKAFALVREASFRVLGQRHYDVQLIGGISIHRGNIVEMRTGEGKTLSATLPAYLNALLGFGVHVVTVNDYLAKRDAEWMGRVYKFLGLTVACLVHEGALIFDPNFNKEPIVENEKEKFTSNFLIQKEYLRPISRKEAYLADITYGTNHEFGFDYLRDNLTRSLADQVQRGYNFAIIDEVDSILIDEARTPLIISAPDEESSELYKVFTRIAGSLKKDEDYLFEEKTKSVDLLESGIEKIEKTLNIKNLYDPANLRLSHYLQECLRAKEIYLKDKDYVVKQGEIIIVDQFTGRLMQGRRYSGGLHQALEAKEGVAVQKESRTYASISIQNYFRLYKKISGMTGTAQTSAEEFDKVYGVKVVTVPTNREMVRVDKGDLVYKNSKGKYEAMIADVKERNAKGQPVLIGTVSINKNEELSRMLSLAGLKHEVLNAKNNEREGAIIAQAGRLGAITVATNMAGRGVDIILGGNPPDLAESQKVKDVGGLHVIGTERHESRRIDNQLRGRAGRQGDPGSSQFFLSLEDDLMRVFGGDRIKGFMEAFKLPDETPIESKLISRVISQAQSKVEGLNFDSRKHLLEYDDVLNRQRTAIYRKRQEFLKSNTNQNILGVLDSFWMNHLENMEALRESVYLRAYGQHDPLVEYKREGHILYQEMLGGFEKWIEENKDKLNEIENVESKNGETNNHQHNGHQHSHTHPVIASNNIDPKFKGVGRNDDCPCGSGKKFKKCHGA